MNKQIAGYTGPTPAAGLVKFFAAFVDQTGDLVLQVRNDAVINEITIPRASAHEIAAAIVANSGSGAAGVKAIQAAVDEVEKIGAHPELTQVVIALGDAKKRLADHIAKP